MSKLLGMIEINLQSETILGGDGIQQGTVDMDIQTDEYGFPYFSGRTLKGVLRREADWFVSHLSGEKKSCFKKAVCSLFGEGDQKGGHQANYDSLKFGEARVSDQLQEMVKEYDLSNQDILHAMTFVRSMTSIDRETGTGKEGSLRQARAIKKGYTLFAPVFTTRALKEQEKELLETTVKLLRRIGMMRSRGKGAVTCQLHWRDKEQREDKSSVQVTLDERTTYIGVNIYTEEPLKINDVTRTSDSTKALNYIPGHVLRGALIHAYLGEYGYSHHNNELETETIFNDDLIQFWNGYLKIDGKRSIPFPDHLYETKESSRSSETSKEIYNALDKERFKCIVDKAPVRVSEDMMVFSDDGLVSSSVKKESSLHLALRNNKSDSQLYRYEGIASEQIFEAVIKAKTDHDFVKWLLERKERTLWLGGARNSGYGRSLVSFSLLDKHPEESLAHEVSDVKELYVLATSDWLIQNEHGQYVHALDEDILSRALGGKVKLKEHVVNTSMTGGYISPWEAYRPMVRSVKAGSIYKYKVKEPIDKSKLKSLMEKGIGQRRNEGFGRLLILPSWPYEKLEKEKVLELGSDSVIRQHSEQVQAKREKQQFIQDFLTYELASEMERQVNQWYASIKEHFDTLQQQGRSWSSLTSTQIGNLLEQTTLIEERMQDSSNKLDIYTDKWGSFWKSYEERISNKSSLGYELIEINNMSLKNFMIEYLPSIRWSSDIFKGERSETEDIEWSTKALRLLLQMFLRDPESPIKQKQEGA